LPDSIKERESGSWSREAEDKVWRGILAGLRAPKFEGILTMGEADRAASMVDAKKRKMNDVELVR